MPYAYSDFGGLAVAFSPADERTIDKALKQLDPSLFLDKEYEPIGPQGPFVFFCVKNWVGSGHPPIPVLDWRTESGPKPLSHALVEQVKRQEGRMAQALREAEKANQKKRQDAIDAVGEYTEEIARAGYRSARGTKSVNLPRSQSLRQARDKQRSRGRNV